MGAYILRRVLLIIPTLFGIMVVNFVVIQAAPGGPVEQMIAEISGTAVESTARLTGAMMTFFLIGFGLFMLIIGPILFSLAHVLRHGYDWESSRVETAVSNLPMVC